MQKINFTFCRRFDIDYDSSKDRKENIKIIAQQIKDYLKNIDAHEIIKLAAKQYERVSNLDDINDIELE